MTLEERRRKLFGDVVEQAQDAPDGPMGASYVNKTEFLLAEIAQDVKRLTRGIEDIGKLMKGRL